MILKNKKGLERKFRILFEIEDEDKKYIIYEDINTLKIYGGKLQENVLKILSYEEINMLNKMINGLVGR